MGQGPDNMNASSEGSSGAWGSEPPAFPPRTNPERRPIPRRPQSRPVEDTEVVVATTPVTTPVAAMRVQSAPAADETEPANLREDIAQTRAEMSGTIDAIQERLDPQRLVGEAKDAAKEAVQETTGAVREATIGRAEQMAGNVTETARGASSTIMDTIRENPVPTAMAAIGLGWLLMSGKNRSPAGQTSRYEARGSRPAGLYLPPAASGQTQGGAGQVVSKAQATVGDVADQARDTASQVAGGAQDLVSGAADSAGQVASGAQDLVSGAADTAAVTPWLRISISTGIPSSRIDGCSGSVPLVRLASAATLATAPASFGSTPACSTAHVTARFMAPVSRYRASRAAASRRDTVDLPEPDGPSTATTHRSTLALPDSRP